MHGRESARAEALTYCRRRLKPIDAHRCARMHAVIIFGLRGCGYVCMCIHAGWGMGSPRNADRRSKYDRQMMTFLDGKYYVP